MKILFAGTELYWLEKQLHGMQDHGHSFVRHVSEADVIFVDARFYDEYGVLTHGLPMFVFDFWDYPACGDVLKSGWFSWIQPNWLKTGINNGTVRAYFMKNMQASQTYPAWVHPIDYAWRPEWEQPEDTYDQFAARPFDICFVGMTSPPRATALCGLIQSGRFKIDWEFYTVRYSGPVWLDRHRQAKLFIEADGWSLPNRPQQLAWVAAMLKQNSDYRWANEWKHGKDCVRFGGHNGLLIDGDVERISILLDNPDELYEIYRAGRETLRTHFSEEALARYVDSVLGSIE